MLCKSVFIKKWVGYVSKVAAAGWEHLTICSGIPYPPAVWGVRTVRYMRSFGVTFVDLSG